jgi:hypothetical protein
LDTSAHIRPMSVAFDLQSHSRRRVERTIRECDSGGLGLLCPARRRGQVLPRIGLARRRGTEVRVAGFALQAWPGLASESRSQLRLASRGRGRPLHGPGPSRRTGTSPTRLSGSTVDAALDLGVAAERTGDATAMSRHRRGAMRPQRTMTMERALVLPGPPSREDLRGQHATTRHAQCTTMALSTRARAARRRRRTLVQGTAQTQAHAE